MDKSDRISSYMCAHRESKARALGAQNSRLSVHRLVSPAKRGLAKSLPEVMIEVFTFLLLKSSTWSSPSSAQLEVHHKRNSW